MTSSIPKKNLKEAQENIKSFTSKINKMKLALKAAKAFKILGSLK